MMNNYKNLSRAMNLVFDIDMTPDEFLALQQLTESVVSDSKPAKENLKACNMGGEHKYKTGTACGIGYGVCSKCDRSIKEVNGEWLTNE